ncbi:MAG: HAMP domain-containing histidine kinase, partial [Defluviitaleaceae bacterium]|nr:HAMP domain-containing histidine kinase [Defluviitaleaceae bacterium]
NAEKIQAERFKAELITNVSHDIRTPLTSIINYTNLLKSQGLTGDAADYVDVLDKKAIRLKQLLSDLIDASQASTGAVQMDIQALNISEILGQVAGEVSDSFDERDLALVLRQPTEPLYVLADSRHLFRAMENVFSNAAKYALPGTRVFAEIESGGGDVTLTLRNTSQNHIDVPPQALTEQFIRGDLARHSEGSGLGLHIAKSLVELMGGQLEITLRGDLFEVLIILSGQDL